MHGNESVCLENVYDKALDDGSMLFDNIMHSTVESDQSSCFSMSKSEFTIFNPTIFELDKSYVFVDHEKNALCDSYIVQLFMMLLKIIMREENMVVEIFMLLKYLSLC